MKALTPVAPAAAAAATLPVWMGMNISSGERKRERREGGGRRGLKEVGEERERMRGRDRRDDDGAKQVRAAGTNKDKEEQMQMVKSKK